VKKIILACGAAAAAMLISASVSAQTVVNPQPSVTTMQNIAVVQEQSTGNVLRVGAPIPVVLSEFLTTKGKGLQVGQRVQLEVAQDVLLNGRVAIPARSPVEGVLTHVRNKGMWGKSGAIRLHINSVNINGTNIRLKGDMDTRGETGTAGVVGALVVLPVAGFFVTGTSAEMPLNMPGRAFLDQDIALAPVTAPALAVVAPAATMVTTSAVPAAPAKK
jgi:opacity protein-like surface antigen